MFRKPETRSEYIRSAIILNVIVIASAAWASSGYTNYAAHLFELIEQQQPFLLFRLQQSALAFTWVGVSAGLITANIEIIVVKILQRKQLPILERVQNFSMWILFLGIALLMFGNKLINPLWEKTFTEAGYTRCETWLLPGAKAFFNHAWVLEPADCHDPILRKVLKGDLGDIRVDEARQYLEKKHRFLESYDARQSGN